MKPQISECLPLLDACTPSVYIQNSFRITGLTVDASTRSIKRRIDDLKQATELGDAEDEYKHAFALCPPPTIDQIREAAQRLQDPEQRIVQEFFWFWPSAWGSGHVDPAIVSLQRGDSAAMFQTWLSYLSDDAKRGVVGRTKGITIRNPSIIVDTRTIAAAKHNLAVMYQLVALDSEHHALDNDFTSAQLQSVAEYWRTSFKWWDELSEDETFWSLVTERIRLIDDSRLTTGFARRMRATLPAAMDKINAMLAISFAEKGKYPQAANQIVYMQETHPGLDDVQTTLATITQSHKTRIRTAIEKALNVMQRDPAAAGAAATELLQAVEKPMQVMHAIIPADDPEKADLSDSIAETCLKCQVVFGRQTEDWKESLKILDAAIEYAVSPESKANLKENRDVVARNAALDSHMPTLKKAIDEVAALSTVAAKIAAVSSLLMPQLSAIKKTRNLPASTYEFCADFVARFIRGLSVDVFNEHSDLESSTSMLELAMTLATDSTLREQLQNDREHLGKIKAESTKYNVTVALRNDTVQVSREFVRYNDRRLSCADIIAIRFGISKSYTNGIQTECSYLIGLASASSGLSIECNRFMRGEDKVMRDFNCILESLFHHVVPGVVSRVAASIRAGKPYQMEECVLTSKGVKFSTGVLLWKKEHFLPWSDVRSTNSRGSLIVSSARDPNIAVSYSLRAVYNAVVFEFIAKAVANGK